VDVSNPPTRGRIEGVLALRREKESLIYQEFTMKAENADYIHFLKM